MSSHFSLATLFHAVTVWHYILCASFILVSLLPFSVCFNRFCHAFHKPCPVLCNPCASCIHTHTLTLNWWWQGHLADLAVKTTDTKQPQQCFNVVADFGSCRLPGGASMNQTFSNPMYAWSDWGSYGPGFHMVFVIFLEPLLKLMFFLWCRGVLLRQATAIIVPLPWEGLLSLLWCLGGWYMSKSSTWMPSLKTSQQNIAV